MIKLIETFLAIFLLILLFSFASSELKAAPFLVSDPIPDATGKDSAGNPVVYPITHCSLAIDANARIDSPVLNKACHYDLATLPTGTHVVKAKAVVINPNWRAESVDTPVFTFSIYPSVAIPYGIQVIP